MSLFHSSIGEGLARTERPWWIYGLLGIVFLIGGAVVLGDIALASVISAIAISAAILVSGIFQIIHAFSVRGWSGFFIDLLLGLLYVAAGITLLGNPVTASMSLTLVLGGILIVSGIFRVMLAANLPREEGWALALSGIVAILAGLLILSRWPASGLWVLGLFLGIDLIVHGCAWVAFAFAVRSERAEIAGGWTRQA